jgi:hypothetical protein
MEYAERRKYGLIKYSIYWIDRARKDIWVSTDGTISKESIDEQRRLIKKISQSRLARQSFGFAKAFLKFLTRARLFTLPLVDTNCSAPQCCLYSHRCNRRIRKPRNGKRRARTHIRGR